MEVLQRLALSILSLAELLDQVLLNGLELAHFFTHSVDILLAYRGALSVQPRDFLLLLLLGEGLILQELSLIQTNLLRTLLLYGQIVALLQHSPLMVLLLTFNHEFVCFLQYTKQVIA